MSNFPSVNLINESFYIQYLSNNYILIIIFLQFISYVKMDKDFVFI